VKEAMIDMMFENNIRAEGIIHIPTMLAQDAWPDIAREAFMEDEPDQIWGEIGIEPPYDLDDEGLIFEHLTDNRKFGYLVKFATPVPQDITADSHRLSWGYYSMKWIYAESYEQACEKALDWRQEFINRRREKALKEQADGEEQLKEYGPTCPECGEGPMSPKNPADPHSDEFYCGECLFNDADEDEVAP